MYCIRMETLGGNRMKVLVTGAGGQLGFDVMRELTHRGIEAKGTTRQELPLTDADAMRKCILSYAPDTIIHCAAYTAVDQAEDEPKTALAVNGESTRYLAELCGEIGAKLIYISTDYVFPGTGDEFYETDAPKSPQNVYGRSKLAGEQHVQEVLDRYFIVRISWVFGIHGKNFIRTMLRLSETHDELKVVDDQIGSPTYTVDLSRLLVDLAETEKYGVYHATNEGVCSWAELAAETFRQYGRETRVVPVPSAEYPTKAVRPKNSRMSKKSLDDAGFQRLPNWKDAVGRYLIELSAERER